jgi:hypothetical protein
MKTLTAFFAITVVLLGEAAAEERTDRIDLNRFTCKQFLEMNRDDALIVVGWLQGYYLDEHAPPVVDFAKLAVESVSLANRCVARPRCRFAFDTRTVTGRWLILSPRLRWLAEWAECQGRAPLPS